jgi:tripartite-type tricarboxylate transporter receptor subunit TctC
VQAGPDDGSVFVFGVDPYLSQSIIAPNAKYGLDDWAFVAVQENDAISITGHKDSPYNSLGEIIEATRKAPNTITVGVPAGGGPQLQLLTIAGVLDNFPYREVTYEGSTYRNALLGKHVDVVFSSASGDLAIQDNAKVVAVASDEPFPGWEGAEPINKALKPYGIDVPYIGAIRFVAFKAPFREKHPDLWAAFNESYKKAVNSPGFQANITKSGEIVVTRKDPLNNPRGLIADNLLAIQKYQTK